MSLAETNKYILADPGIRGQLDKRMENYESKQNMGIVQQIFQESELDTDTRPNKPEPFFLCKKITTTKVHRESKFPVFIYGV